MSEQGRFLKELKHALSHLNSVKEKAENQTEDNEVSNIKGVSIEPGRVKHVSAQIMCGRTETQDSRIKVPPIFVQTSSSMTSCLASKASPVKSPYSSGLDFSSFGSEKLSPLAEEHVIAPSSVLMVTKARAVMSKQNVSNIRNTFAEMKLAENKQMNSPKKTIGMIKNRRMRAVHEDLYKELNSVLKRHTESITPPRGSNTRINLHQSMPCLNTTVDKVASMSAPDIRVEYAISPQIETPEMIPSLNHYESVTLPVSTRSTCDTDNEYMDIDLLQKSVLMNDKLIMDPHPPLPPPPPPLPKHFKTMPQLRLKTTPNNNKTSLQKQNQTIFQPCAKTTLNDEKHIVKHKRTQSATYTKTNVIAAPTLKSSHSVDEIYESQEQTCDIISTDCSYLTDSYNDAHMYALYSKKPNYNSDVSSDVPSTPSYNSNQPSFHPGEMVTDLINKVSPFSRWDSGAPASSACITSSDALSDSTVSTEHVPVDHPSLKYLMPNHAAIKFLKPSPANSAANIQSDMSMTTLTSCDNSINDELTKNSSLLCSSFEHVPVHRNKTLTECMPWSDLLSEAPLRHDVLSGVSSRNIQSFAGASTLEGQQMFLKTNAPMFVKVIPSVPDLNIVKIEPTDSSNSSSSSKHTSNTNSLDRHLDGHCKRQNVKTTNFNQIYATYPPKSIRRDDYDENTITNLMIQQSGERIPPDGAETTIMNKPNILGATRCVNHKLTVPQPASFHTGMQTNTMLIPDWSKSGSNYNLCGKPTSFYGKDFSAHAIYEESTHRRGEHEAQQPSINDTYAFYRNRYPYSDTSLRDVDNLPAYRTHSASTNEQTDLSLQETSSPDERRGLFRKKLSSASEKESQRHMLYHTWSSMAAKRQHEKSKYKMSNWKKIGRSSKLDEDSDSSCQSINRGIKPRLLRNTSSCSSVTLSSLHGEAGVYKKRDRSQSTHIEPKDRFHSGHIDTMHPYVSSTEMQEHPSDADTESLYQDLDAYERSLFQYVRRSGDISQRSADIRSLYWQQLDSVSCKHRSSRTSRSSGGLLQRLWCCFMRPGHNHSSAAAMAARVTQRKHRPHRHGRIIIIPFVSCHYFSEIMFFHEVERRFSQEEVLYRMRVL